MPEYEDRREAMASGELVNSILAAVALRGVAEVHGQEAFLCGNIGAVVEYLMGAHGIRVREDFHRRCLVFFRPEEERGTRAFWAAGANVPSPPPPAPLPRRRIRFMGEKP